MKNLLKASAFIIASTCLIACGGSDAPSKPSKRKAKTEISPKQFIKACTTYFNNGSTEKVTGRYNPVPDVQAFGVSKYCECVEGDMNAAAARAMGNLETLTGDEMKDLNDSVVNSAMTAKMRSGGYELYTEMLAFDKKPEGKMRPGTYKLLGAADACNKKIMATR